MSIKRKQNKKPTFSIFYDPYAEDEKTDDSGRLTRYLKDDHAVVEIDGKTYYRAIQIFFLSNQLIAFLDNRMDLKMGDSVSDDNENIYTVKGFAMIRFKCEIPEWFRYAGFVMLSGTHENIGHFFTKIHQPTANK